MKTSHPHHASPWVIDTRPIGRRPGTLKRLERSIELTTPIGLPVIAVPPGAAIELNLRLESVAEGVLVSGTVSGSAVGECARCLTEVSQPVTADLLDLYAYTDSTTAETTDADEIPRLVDDLLDLEPLVTDEVVLALPMVPLCRPDCPGLCSECGQRLAELPADHSHETIDPRWAALAGRVVRPSAERDSS